MVIAQVEETLRRLSYAADTSVARSIAERYRRLRTEGTDLLPGAVEAVEAMREAGVKLALLTNGTSQGQRAKIERFDLARHFDYICIEGEFDYHVGDEVYHMTPGSMLRVPPGVMHYAQPTGKTVAKNLDVFAPIRDDYNHLVEYQAADFAS